MGIGDSFRNFFSKRKGPDLRHLERVGGGPSAAWRGTSSRETTTNPTTLLLVDRDGDHASCSRTRPDHGPQVLREARHPRLRRAGDRLSETDA